MKYLIDTHYVLWSLFDQQKIPEIVSDVLLDDQSIKYVSSISIWEISLKYGLGKLSLGNKTPEDVSDAVTEAGFQILPIAHYLYATYYKLPRKYNHRDPFDRMLIWQAINLNFTLISADSKISQYESDGLVVLQ